MNHSIPPRELRRWHAWFDKPWPKWKAEILEKAHRKAFLHYSVALANGNQQEMGRLLEIARARLSEWNAYARNPSRHDPRNGCRP